mgnify:CR=1 FL=1|jgi:ribonuclease HII
MDVASGLNERETRRATQKDLPDLRAEGALWSAGFGRVAGLDEVGRGAWAGPVVAGAVILPPDAGVGARLSGVRDSKQMSSAQRERWAQEIRRVALAWGLGAASAAEIDALGIVPATRLAMRRALAALQPAAQALLVDALRLPDVLLPQRALVHGDARVLSIASASVLAKVARDARMELYAGEYPGYGFEHHKAYGTAEHREALERLGACPIHRRSFAPLRNGPE